MDVNNFDKKLVSNTKIKKLENIDESLKSK